MSPVESWERMLAFRVHTKRNERGGVRQFCISEICHGPLWLFVYLNDLLDRRYVSCDLYSVSLYTLIHKVISLRRIRLYIEYT